jgi:hypothetical protein
MSALQRDARRVNAWQRRTESYRHQQDRALLKTIGEVFARALNSDAELTRLLQSYYIPYYNGVHLHSGIGYASPVDYEARTT